MTKAPEVRSGDSFACRQTATIDHLATPFHTECLSSPAAVIARYSTSAFMTDRTQIAFGRRPGTESGGFALSKASSFVSSSVLCFMFQPVPTLPTNVRLPPSLRAR